MPRHETGTLRLDRWEVKADFSSLTSTPHRKELTESAGLRTIPLSMVPVSEENQLELFDVASQAAPRPHRELVGQVRLHLRYDQLVLTSVIGILGLTVIFACGVERGKQLARYEGGSAPSALETPTAAVPELPAAPMPTKTATQRVPASGVSPKAKTPGKPAMVKSRYAVQVVTFSRLVLAKQELERLQSRGERAFLVAREGRTAVYVGPFTSKNNASEKVSTLKTHYQDCFVRVL